MTGMVAAASPKSIAGFKNVINYKSEINSIYYKGELIISKIVISQSEFYISIFLLIFICLSV